MQQTSISNKINNVLIFSVIKHIHFNYNACNTNASKYEQTIKSEIIKLW